ncbi:hypothetical protein HanIR_Chr08g0367761 [Helianthus annuus]|nr:hypothetical protein HanIR_Chr08g0367761 [Helianthus annuus]
MHITEEVSGLTRPRKRTRQNDPFDLNEIIGIQVDNHSSGFHDSNVDKNNEKGDSIENEANATNSFTGENLVEGWNINTVKDLNLQPNEEEDVINLETHVTSMLGSVVRADLNKYEHLIRDVITEEGIQKVNK